MLENMYLSYREPTSMQKLRVEFESHEQKRCVNVAGTSQEIQRPVFIILFKKTNWTSCGFIICLTSVRFCFVGSQLLPSV